MLVSGVYDGGSKNNVCTINSNFINGSFLL